MKKLTGMGFPYFDGELNERQVTSSLLVTPTGGPPDTLDTP